MTDERKAKSTVVDWNEEEHDVEINHMDDDAEDIEVVIPDELPILPLRGVVVYPQTIIPLTVGQPRSIKLVDEVVSGNRMIGLITSKDPSLETPGPDDIHRVGTIASIHRLFRAPDGTIRMLVQGVSRISVDEFTSTEPYLKAHAVSAPETVETSIEVEALTRNVIGLFTRLAELVPSIPGELISSALNVDDPLQLAYTIATYIRIDLDEAQALLEMDSTEAKLRRLMTLLSKELEVLELGRKIQTEAQTEMEKVQREYYLREQLKAIQRELGEADEQAVEVEEFRQKIAEAGMPEEAKKEAERELDRLSKLPTAAAEYGVIRTYLDWLTSLPWSQRSEDNLDIAHAREVLDEDHYGLKDVKERILEYLAVRKLRMERAEEIESAENSRHDPARPSGRDPVLRRSSRRRQDLAGRVDCAGDESQVYSHELGRCPRRSRNSRFPADLHRRDARSHHPDHSPRRDAQPDHHAR